MEDYPKDSKRKCLSTAIWLDSKKWPCYVKQAYNCTPKYYLTFSEAQRSIGKISIPTNSFKNIFGAHDAANSIVVFTC